MTPQPMSRRQRREAERAAEAARQVTDAQVGAVPSSPSTTHTTHVAGATRRSRRDLHTHRAETGAAPSPVTAPSPSALPDVPLAPQKRNHPQRPVVPAAPPTAVSGTRTATRPENGSAPSVPGDPAQSQPVAPMSRMARRRQSAIERPEPTSHPHASAAQAHSAASEAPSVSSSPQVTGDTQPTRRSRKALRAAHVFEDTQQTPGNPAVASAPQPQGHRLEDFSEHRNDQRRSHGREHAAPSAAPSTPSALSPLVAASLAESTSGLEPATGHPAGATPWWAGSDTAPASSSGTQRHRHAAAQASPAEPEVGAASGAASRSGGRRRQRASAAAPASVSTTSAKPVVASTPHHADLFSAPGTQVDRAATQTPQAESSAPVEQAPFAPDTPHEIRFSQRITDFRGAETVEVPEVRKIMAARKAGVPLADEAAIHAIKAARSSRRTKPERTAAETKESKAADEADAPTSSARNTAASKPDAHRDSSTGPAPARPVRRRTGSGILGRTAVLSALAVATVLAPLSSHLDNTPLASAAMKMHSNGSATQNPAAGGTKSSSVASAVLGSDDLDEGSDTQLSNVPDAATRARIREAFQNAAKTCSSATGASGDTSAFSSKPQLFYPMLPGTYEISSEYGYRTHPTLGYRKLHAGQDMAASVGTPIYAAAAGTVTTAGMVDGTGTITIKHEIDGQVWYTSYLHMYEDGIHVKVGDTVKAGQMIAGVGNTGRSSGSHLHFEVRTKDDTADESTVEPWGWLKQHNAVELTTNCS